MMKHGFVQIVGKHRQALWLKLLSTSISSRGQQCLPNKPKWRRGQKSSLLWRNVVLWYFSKLWWPAGFPSQAVKWRPRELYRSNREVQQCQGDFPPMMQVEYIPVIADNRRPDRCSHWGSQSLPGFCGVHKWLTFQRQSTFPHRDLPKREVSGIL